jgi:hypothetical protein
VNDGYNLCFGIKISREAHAIRLTIEVNRQVLHWVLNYRMWAVITGDG